MCHISWLKALPCAIPQNLTLIDFEADRRSCLTYIFTYFVTRKHDVSIQSDPVRELEPLCNHSYTATQGTYYVSSAQPLFQIYLIGFTAASRTDTAGTEITGREKRGTRLLVSRERSDRFDGTRFSRSSVRDYLCPDLQQRYGQLTN